MTPDFVVNESLRGFDRGQCIVIPGWQYKLAAAGLRMLPRALLHRMVIGAARYRRRRI